MEKKLLLAFLVATFLGVLPLNSINAADDWHYLDLGLTNQLNGVWGSAADDVYVVGTLGINMHYDGNPEGTWEVNDKKSG